jgi:cytochrome c oxidase cbb3-type subunit III
MRRALLVLLLLCFSCEREKRRFKSVPAASQMSEGKVVSELRPGGLTQKAAAGQSPYEGNAWGVSEGKRLYSQFNCVGCHAHGGGSIGPPLMDNKWRYGGEPANIFSSIVEGRPNGMPAFRGKIDDDDVWKLVAYLQALAGHLDTDVSPSRDDHMSVVKPEAMQPKHPPKYEGPVQ